MKEKLTSEEAEAELPDVEVPVPAELLELRSVAAMFGSVVMAVTPALLEAAKLTPVGRLPFSPF